MQLLLKVTIDTVCLSFTTNSIVLFYPPKPPGTIVTIDDTLNEEVVNADERQWC